MLVSIGIANNYDEHVKNSKKKMISLKSQLVYESFIAFGIIPIKSFIYVAYLTINVFSAMKDFDLLQTLPEQILLFVEVNKNSIIILIAIDRISSIYTKEKKRISDIKEIYKPITTDSIN